jgi:hypothetical protein
MSSNEKLNNIEQRGGFGIELIATIPKFVISVVVYILTSLKDLLIALLNPKVWQAGQGLLWKYMWWCLKVAGYLVVFSFGGPLLILIGIIMLYSNLAKKIGTLKSKEELNDEENPQEQETEDADD